MDTYIYAADIYCADCAQDIMTVQSLNAGQMTPPYRDDSAEYPQGPHSDGGGKADSPQHCAAGQDCINALEVGGYRVGCWLENALTQEGYAYVREACAEQPPGLVAHLWREWYPEAWEKGLHAEIVQRLLHENASDL